MDRRGWGLVLVAATGLALVSLASNATTMNQIDAETDTLLVLRKAVSQLLNSGTIWAGLAVASGWLVRRPVQAALAGVVALLTALIVHYGLGWLLGLFDPAGVWSNSYWFVAALVVGGPLGLVGATARRSDLWGLLARLLVPVAAALEPFAIGMFASPAVMPSPQRLANLTSGSVLLTVGAAGCVWVLAGVGRRHAPQEQRVPAEP